MLIALILLNNSDIQNSPINETLGCFEKYKSMFKLDNLE